MQSTNAQCKLNRCADDLSEYPKEPVATLGPGANGLDLKRISSKADVAVRKRQPARVRVDNSAQADVVFRKSMNTILTNSHL